jgi:flagellar hook-associated protein 3
MTNRISSSQMANSNLISMLNQQKELNRTMSQISSGLRYQTPADDPMSANSLFKLYQQTASLDGYTRGVDVANTNLSYEDNILQQVATTLNSARDIVVALNSGSLTMTDVKINTTQLETVLAQLTDLANSKVNGRYLFSGSKDMPPVYKHPNGVYAYQGDQEYQNATIARKISIQLNDTAQDIFFQLPTNDVALTGFTSRTNITAANPGLVNPGVLTASNSLIAHELKLNGIDIGAAIAGNDTLSTSDNIASAKAISAAINASSALTKVNAYYDPNIVTFTGGGAYIDHVFVAGELVINGVNIVGDSSLQAGATPVDRISALINTHFPAPAPGDSIIASNNAGQLRLTSIDGTNMQLTSTGGDPANLTLTGFNFTLGDNKVQRANVTLKSEQAVAIATNTFVTNNNAVGFAPGNYAVISNAGNAVMSAPIMRNLDPNIALTQNYIVSFTSATTYNVYKKSAPLTPLTNFEVYHLGENYEKNATKVATVPATYAAGDSIVIEGMEITITGVPAANDSFVVNKVQEPINDIFNALANVISAAKDYKGQNTRYNYHMNIALTNITNSHISVTNTLGVVGARLNRVEIQNRANSKLEEFTQENISGIRDVDMAAVISQYSQALTSLQAAQAITAQTKSLSLFNYL